MEKVQDIYCLKTSKRLFSFNNPTGDAAVFVFTDEKAADNFVEQLALYAPEFPLIYLSYGTVKDLRAFLLQNPMYVYVSPTLELALAKCDFQDTTDSFLVKIKETQLEES